MIGGFALSNPYPYRRPRGKREEEIVDFFGVCLLGAGIRGLEG